MTENDRPKDADQAAEPADSGKTSDNSSDVPAYVPEPPPQDEPKRGSISYQDERTAPKKPSVAEQRARRDAQRRQREAEQAEYEEAERKRKKRKRILIGSGVTVGVVALVAVIYAASQPDEVTATCTDTNGVVVDDDYCDSTYASSHGGYTSGGFIFIGGSSYRYNYGGTGAVGQKVSGGSYVSPSSGTTVKTRSGSTVQRGGLGVSSGGKSGGS
ncbi:hypothetical protein [Actinokineospora diospyrosa]|uniref:Uncharacterized protein n=1 Tax=Actinokineospora diospyrosa TaxID=103728 RepID=A0ABT1ID25_9PSEU|nr:hypothetical protein [Actinokineospora diospyrosa]MCP2270537.1 hypothetical protein [Actinokineospora diospyrosa]